MDETLNALRARIQEIEGRPVAGVASLPSGVRSLDEAVGGLPQPGIVEVCGKRGAGRTRMALAATAACTARGERVAWVDPAGLCYPPTAEGFGVTLSQMLLVTPEEHQASWAVEQLLRSGCLPLVVVVEPVMPTGAGARWARAARRGVCTLMVLSERSVASMPADLRLTVQEREGLVKRVRAGGGGRRFEVPPWPEGLDPWA